MTQSAAPAARTGGSAGPEWLGRHPEAAETRISGARDRPEATVSLVRRAGAALFRSYAVQLTTKTERRFWAQEDSVEPSTAGRSLP